MIQTLEAKGFTYRTSDGLYFDTSKDPGYGLLSRAQLDFQVAVYRDVLQPHRTGEDHRAHDSGQEDQVV